MKPEPLGQKPTSSLVDAGNQFAVELYRHIRMTESSNLFFSPFSVATALALAYAGASGLTRQEMKAAMRLPDHPAIVHPHLANLIKTVFSPNSRDIRISLANRMWAQAGYRLLPAFLDTLKTHYETSLDSLDFVSEAESAVRTINDWVARQTEGKVPELISPQDLNELTRLIVVNAIYFRGTWQSPFENVDTHDATFHVSPQQRTPVRMMHQQSHFAYREVDDVQIVELPYGMKEEMSLVIFLPRKSEQLTNVEHSLSSELLNRWLGSLEHQTVQVFLPKFWIRQRLQLVPMLSAMGMASAFSPTCADFSGMTDETPGLCISQIIHEAFVEVDEQGTEATAATAMTMMLGSSAIDPRVQRIPIFRADHPFIFLIRHVESGTVLFLGRVMNPLQKD